MQGQVLELSESLSPSQLSPCAPALSAPPQALVPAAHLRSHEHEHPPGEWGSAIPSCRRLAFQTPGMGTICQERVDTTL